MTGLPLFLQLGPRSTPIRIAVFAVVSLCSFAQSGAEKGISPKEVVERFVRADASGARLTAPGRVRIAALFLRPTPLTQGLTLTVGTCEPFGKVTITGSRAEVWTEGYQWGTIDAAARFKAVAPGPDGHSSGPVEMRQQYLLAFSDSYLELAADGLSVKEAKGRPAWRIASADPGPHVSIGTAIRYLMDLRDSSSDPTIRKNAEESLAALKGLR